MCKKYLFALLFLLFPLILSASDKYISLDGFWKFKTDPYYTGVEERWYDEKYSVQGWDTLSVPGNWDLRNEYAHYVGQGWYRRCFDTPQYINGKDVFIRFEAVNVNYIVWLNGKKIGEVQGGYFPNEWDITGLLKKNGKNTVAVCVDNNFRSGAYWSWGGIRRHVDLCIRPKNRIDKIKISAEPDLKKGTANICIRTMVNVLDDGYSLKYTILKDGKKLKQKKVNADASSTDIYLSKRQTSLWHFDAPELYILKAELEKDGILVDEHTERFGIRKIECDSNAFYLNGEPIRCLGLNWVADDRLTGNTLPASVYKKHLDDMRRMGVVMARLSHVPLPKDVLDYLDEIGMLVIDEIPVWGASPLATPDNPVAFSWIRQMVDNHYNHPSIVAWSVGNEIGNQVNNPKVTPYVKAACELARSLDKSRPALDVSNSAHANKINDPSQYSDFYAFNCYSRNCYGKYPERIIENYGRKPLFMTEFGCRLIGENLENGFDIERVALEQMRGKDFIFGGSLWTYNDYRSTHYSPTPSWNNPISENRAWGVVDAYGRHKRAYYEARKEYAPLKEMKVVEEGDRLIVNLIPRDKLDLPAYILRNYKLQLETGDGVDNWNVVSSVELPDINPGDKAMKREMKMPSVSSKTYRLMLVNGQGVELMDTLIVHGKPEKPSILSVITANRSARVYFRPDGLGSRYFVECKNLKNGRIAYSDTVAYSDFIDVMKLSRDTQYQLTLFAENNNGKISSETVAFTAKGNGVLPPDIKSIVALPESKSIGLGYGSLNNEYLYEIEYSRDKMMKDGVKRLITKTRGACTIPNLCPGVYYVRMRAHQQYQIISDWTPVVSVKLDK